MKYEEFLKVYPDCYVSDVRWGEMDSLQHVNNTNFFRYFESARMVFWAGLEKRVQGQVPPNIGPILASTSCRFKRPLYYPDKIAIGANVLAIADDRFTVGHAVWSEKENAIVAEGDAVIVSFDYHTKKKVPLPLAWKTIMSQGLRTPPSQV